MKSPWFLLAALLALAGAAAATWPAFSSPTDTLLCNYVHPDCLSNHWLLVWVAERLSAGESILWNDWYYWPVGDAPWLAGNGSEGIAYLPWHLLFGWPVASTIHLVLLLFLNGMSCYALSRAAGASPPAAVAAAPTGALLLYAIHELGAGRFTQVSACWLVFFLAAWLRFLADPGPRRAVVAALLFATTCLFYWYYGLFAAMAGALLWGARAIGAWMARRRGDPVATGDVSPDEAAPQETGDVRGGVAGGRSPPAPNIGQLATFVVCALVATAPLLWVFLRHWSAIPGTTEAAFPHPESVGDSTWPKVPFFVSGGRHAGLALPFTTTVLAIPGLLRKEGRWIGLGLGAVALFFAALMAGALFPHGPYEWIYGLAGPLRRFWWPYRHVVVLNVALIALAARGAETLVRRRPWVGALLALSIPLQLELQGAPWHAHFTKAELPEPFYAALAEKPGDVLVEPPLSPEVAGGQAHLIYQLFHRKKLVAGHALWVERVRPDAWDDFVAANSFLTEMQKLERAELTDGVFRFDAADLEALRSRGVRVFVLNREYFPVAMRGLVDAYEDVFRGLFGPTTLQGKRQKAWDAAAWDGKTAEVRFEPFAWPKGIAPGGPTLSMQAPRWGSTVFSVPAPPKPPKKGGPKGPSDATPPRR